jgi:hypothetical protein
MRLKLTPMGAMPHPDTFRAAETGRSHSPSILSASSIYNIGVLKKQIRFLSLTMLMVLSLLSGWTVAVAQVCDNPWGTALQNNDLRSATLKPEDVHLCLPAGFIPESKEDGILFRDPADTKGTRGRIGLAISVDTKYKNSDLVEDYEKLKMWLCQLSNISAGTLCSVTKIQGKLYVVLKGVQVGANSEAYIHVGNGYMLALTAEAPDDAAYAILSAVLRGATIP